MGDTEMVRGSQCWERLQRWSYRGLLEWRRLASLSVEQRQPLHEQLIHLQTLVLQALIQSLGRRQVLIHT